MSKGRKHHQAEEMEEDSRQATGRSESNESDMMCMFRAMMAEQRKADEAREERRMVEDQKREEARMAEVRRLEEARQVEAKRLEEVRVERELEVVAKQAEIQKEIEQRQYDQQVALLKIQKEMGEAASLANREIHTTDRKRDRALYSIPLLKDGEDLEEFLSTAERRLSVADVRREDWISMIDSKLTGKIASTWQDILAGTGEYMEARDRLLKSCGYTPKSASEKLFSFKEEQSRGLTADQLYHRGQQLLRWSAAPGKLSEEMEFSILRGWVAGVIPKRAKAALDARSVENSLGLVDALRDYLELEGDRNEGQSAIFRKNGVEPVRERSSSITCFKCGRVGHKAVDCWKGGAGSAGTGSVSSGGVAPKPIVCYTCGEPGHKSPQCPKYVRDEKAWPKDSEAKSVKRIWWSQEKGVQLEGVVNGHVTKVLLDSGAAISVVPEYLVSGDQMTGNTVAVMPFGAEESMVMPVAEVSFGVDRVKWMERVAVQSEQQGARREVLISLDIQSKRGLELVLVANRASPSEFFRCMTKCGYPEDKKKEEEEAMLAEREEPRAEPCSEELNLNNEMEVKIRRIEVCAREGDLDRKEEELEGGVLCIEEEFEKGVLCIEEECLCIEENAWAEDEEEGDRRKSELRGEREFEVKVGRDELLYQYEPLEVRAVNVVDVVGPKPKGIGCAHMDCENQNTEEMLVEIWKRVRSGRGESANSNRKSGFDKKLERGEVVTGRADYRADLGKGQLKILNSNKRKKFRIRMKEDEGGGMTGNGQSSGDGSGYHRRLMKDLANFSRRLITSTSAPSVVNWSGEKLDAFNKLKGMLVSVCVLTIPSQEDCFSLRTDASGGGVGATLNVVNEDNLVADGLSRQAWCTSDFDSNCLLGEGEEQPRAAEVSLLGEMWGQAPRKR